MKPVHTFQDTEGMLRLRPNDDACPVLEKEPEDILSVVITGVEVLANRRLDQWAVIAH